MTIETIDVTPHWPGMLRWLQHAAECQFGKTPNAVAITGGDDTAMFAVYGDDVFVRVEGTFVQTAPAMAVEKLEEQAYCRANYDLSHIWVAGKRVV